MKFSVLDSAPVRVDGTGAEALTESLERAQQLDQIGCHRLWFTEHHLAPDVASTSPLTMVGQVADPNDQPPTRGRRSNDPQPPTTGCR